MAKEEWWFQFEWDDWLGDSDLNACSLETQGFWIKCIAMMRRAKVSEFCGSLDSLRRKFGILPEELSRCLNDLKENNAANVTFGNGIVTIESRRLLRELKAKEKNRLKVARHREKPDGNPDVTTHNKSKSKNHNKKSLSNLDFREESRVSDDATPLKKPENPKPETNGVSNHPAVVVYEEIFGRPDAAFAKAITIAVTDLGLWSNLVTEKSSYEKPEKWILGEYHKRVAESPPGSDHPPAKLKTSKEVIAEDRERERKLNLEFLERLAAENGTTVEEEDEKIRQKYRRPKQAEQPENAA